MMAVYLVILTAIVLLTAEWRTQNYAERLNKQKIAAAVDLVQAFDETLLLTIDFNKPVENVQLIERYRKQLSDLMMIAEFTEVTIMYPAKDGPEIGLRSGEYAHSLAEIDHIKSHAKSFFDNNDPMPLLTANSSKDSIVVSVFVPFLNKWSDEVHSVFVFTSRSNECFTMLQSFRAGFLWVSFSAILLLLIIFILIGLRDAKPAAVQTKYRHIETVGVFLMGAYITVISVFIVRDMAQTEMVSAFKNETSPHVSAIRHGFWKIRQNLSAFSAFIQSSDEVDEREFFQFARSLDHRSPISGVSYYEKDIVSANNVQGVLKVVPGTAYHIIHEYGNSELLLNSYMYQTFTDELKALLEKTEQSLLPEASRMFMLGSGSTDRYYLAAFPVDFSHTPNPQKFGVIVSLISPFQLLKNSLAVYADSHKNIPFGIGELMSTAGSEWYASWPPEHIEMHKHENIGVHLKSFTHSEKYPVFAFGRTYVVMTHSSAEFESPFYTVKLYPVLIALIIISLLATFVTYMLKNRLLGLETQVNERTQQLKRKLSELETVGQLLERLQFSANIHDVMDWFPQFFCKAFSGNAELCLQIRYGNEVYQCESPSVFEVAYLSKNIVVSNNNLGEIRIASMNDKPLQKEDEALLEKYASIFNRWLEHQQLASDLHQSEQRFHELINASFDSIYLIENNRFVWVNDAFCQLTGYTREELTSADFDMDVMVTHKSRDIIHQRKEARKLGLSVPARYEFEQKTKAGEVKEVEVTTVAIPGTASLTIMGILRDISDRKKVMNALVESEERLQQQNEELQVLNEELTVSSGQIREMNLELLKAKELAEASDKLKTAFLNNISHEVRTPLNGIMGASTLMADPDSTGDERAEMAAIIQQSTTRLLRTITQYMDISMLSSGTMPVYITEFKLNDAVQPLFAEFGLHCAAKKLRFETEIPDQEIVFESDKSLIEKVLYHLLDNAVKFTDHGKVSCKVKQQDQRILFTIEDTGIGIDKHFHARIYESFAQEDDSNVRKYDGSGLGLPICKLAVELLGGTINFESEKGQGTRFDVSLPGKLNKKITKEPDRKEKVMAQGPVILIAEDEDSNFTVLNMLLEKRLKARVIRAVNGQEAVDQVRKNSEIQLVLMDIKMPVMDGFEATRLIKALRPEIPVIAITAYGLSGDEQKALDAGCNDYLAKPIQTSQLFEKISKLT